MFKGYQERVSQLLARGALRLVVDGLDPQYWKGQVRQLAVMMLDLLFTLIAGTCDFGGGGCLLALVMQQL